MFEFVRGDFDAFFMSEGWVGCFDCGVGALHVWLVALIFEEELLKGCRCEVLVRMKVGYWFRGVAHPYSVVLREESSCG